MIKMNKGMAIIGALIVAPLGVSVSSAAGNKANGYYLRADLGVGLSTKGKGTYYGQNTDYHKLSKKPFIASVGLGKQFHPNFRADVTVTHMPKIQYKAYNSTDGATVSQDITVSTAMLNGYLEYPVQKFTPYINLGVGYGLTKSSNMVTYTKRGTLVVAGKNGSGFAWQTGAGVAYQLNENLALDLGYRYMNLPKTKSASQSTLYAYGQQVKASVPSRHLKLHTHAVTLGLRFNFSL